MTLTLTYMNFLFVIFTVSIFLSTQCHPHFPTNDPLIVLKIFKDSFPDGCRFAFTSRTIKDIVKDTDEYRACVMLGNANGSADEALISATLDCTTAHHKSLLRTLCPFSIATLQNSFFSAAVDNQCQHANVLMNQILDSIDGGCAGHGFNRNTTQVFSNFLVVAAENYRPALVKRLLEEYRADPNYAHARSIVKVARLGYLDILMMMQARGGANFHANDGAALVNAAYYGYYDVALYLLKHNGGSCFTRAGAALRCSVFAGHFWTVKALLEYGCPVDLITRDEYWVVANRGDADLVDLLQRSGWNYRTAPSGLIDLRTCRE